MRDEYIQELKSAFESVDIKNAESLKSWFKDHPYLTTNDHAQIVGKSASYIRSLKRKAGIKGKRPTHIPIHTNINTTCVTPPENWDTEKWLSKAAKLYSARQIS